MQKSTSWRILGFFLVSLTWSLPLSATTSEAIFQPNSVDVALKNDFEAWWAAAKKNDAAQVAKFEQQFANHPLFPMGRYLFLLENLNTTQQQTIVDFINTYPQLGLSVRLQQRYLDTLANNQAWSHILTSQLTPSNQQQQCLAKRALMANQPNQLPLNDWQNFWLTNLNLHTSCREIERHLHRQGLLDSDALLARLKLLFEQQRHAQVPSIIAMLPPQEKGWSQAWLNLVQQPHRVNEFNFESLPAHIRPQVAYTSLVALSRTDPEQVLLLRQQAPFKSLLTPEQQIQLQREAGLRLTYRFDEQGWQTLNQLNDYAAEEATLIWQARFAIRYSKWADLARITSDMPESLATQAQWRYWRARALTEMGDQQALALFEQLATERNYYGFLAADRLGKPYAIHRTADYAITISQERASALIQSYPSLHLIAALVDIDWRINAHREWHHLLNIAKTEDFYDLAALAHAWGLHHLAITTLGQIQAWDALDKRFPAPFNQTVIRQAESQQLASSLIYSIMRRESAFYPQARSPAGAEGLMQLMPNTAREVAQKQGLRSFNPRDIFDADINIQLGSAYLAELLARYNHPVLAIAAYNAGPSRVNQWLVDLNGANSIEADQWIDTLPFFETRRYVRQVLEHKLVYDFILANPHATPITTYVSSQLNTIEQNTDANDWIPPQRLSSLMTPVTLR
ncbi:lytic transglycosylase [Thiomicrospira aerophila AL3]|uniref:Lytic transglycosylase n=1 Tax=Thiomicrospira aerophila AL3 TaxID=717772 RepID=W0DVN5_9GAMM|nr:lytic transglycosylase domain-containing protein [Thiomicrospira aerophila]AHF01338.1 lytic transglycosylase [Thiomicrospira aerophila AL3]